MGKRWRLSRGQALDLLVLAAYIVLSLGFCVPLPLRLGTDVAGRYVDTRIFQWNNWWVKYALLNGLDLDDSAYIYAPSGASLVSHNVNWISSFLSVPLDLIFGPTIAYNLTFLFTFFLSGYGMYLLVRDLTDHRGAAFVAGLVFSFAPYHVSGNWDGQMNLANIQWIPLCLRHLLRVVHGKRWQDALWAGFWGALASLDCWFFTMFLGLWSAVFALYLLIWRRKDLSWRLVGLLLLAAGVGLILITPFLLPLFRASGGELMSEALDYYADDKSTDLLAFVTPSSDHPLTGDRDAPLYGRFQHWRPAYLGISVIVLSVWAAVAVRRKSVLWWLTGLLFALLALGTTLDVGGVSYPGVPMPFALLLRWVPAIKVIRQASRFNVMVSLSCAVLVGLACADLSRRITRPRWRTALLVLAGSLVLFEYAAFPCPLSTTQVSQFYHDLAEEEGDFALLELPVDDFHSREYLYPQTIHHKRLVNGYVARTTDETLAFISGHPLLKKLHTQVEVDPEVQDVPAAMRNLAANGVRYVVVHKNALPPQPPVDPRVLADWQTLFGPDVYYEDEELVAYRLPEAQNLGAPETVGASLAVRAIEARRVTLLDESLLSVRLTWMAQADMDRDLACTVSVEGSDGRRVESRVETISPRYPTGVWPEGVVVDDEYLLSMEETWPAGPSTVVVTAMDPGSGQALGMLARQVSLPDEASPLVPALDKIETATDVTYGHEMRLLGFTPCRSADKLTLDMVWMALEATDVDYKVFVHVIHVSTQEIVAQSDAMPRHWSYPTSRWDRGEVFIDRVELDLVGVAPGTYVLWAGVYEPGQDRLEAVDAKGRILPDGRAMLDPALEVEEP